MPHGASSYGSIVRETAVDCKGTLLPEMYKYRPAF